MARDRALPPVGEVSWDASADFEQHAKVLDLQTLRERIAKRLRDDSFPIPPLPDVVVELNAVANSAEPDLRQAARIVERDPQLAGRVLAATSGVLFGGNAPKDLGQAVVRLGTAGLRDLTFALMMGRVFRARSPFEKIMRREHSRCFALALVCAFICRRLGMGHLHGFLAGLLADVGRLALWGVLAEDSTRDEAVLDADPMVDGLHAEVGALVITRWKLETVLREVTLHHHKPEGADGVMPLALAVAAADAALRRAEQCAGDFDRFAEALLEESSVFRCGFPADGIADLAQQVVSSGQEAGLL